MFVSGPPPTFPSMTVAAPARAEPGAELGIGAAARIGIQASFDELGTPLREVTFVVVDLETTGGSAHDCAITEIGAVKVRGGEVLGEFQTLVNPDEPIPPFIAVLTGITDLMVASAPRIEQVLPDFLDFARGAVLVAHNAPFDVGFLRVATERLGRPWPTFGVVDTARLARRVLHRDDAPDCRLSTLARVFRSTTVPNHRALQDARATVDVLHGLIERVGNEGVQSLEELTTFSSRVPAALRRKRFLAEGLPSAPGVYLFEDAQGRILYVGKSRNLRARVRNYFTASESRSRMGEMVGIAERVRHIVCPTTLEAEVRELRLIAAHKPRYNRRSRFPERVLWLKLTVEPFPRLSLVRELRDDGASYLGPFGSRRSADAAMTALHEAFPLRQCTDRLSVRRMRSACALFGMGRCAAPCEGRQSVAAYAEVVTAARTAWEGDAGRFDRRDGAADRPPRRRRALRGRCAAPRPAGGVRPSDGAYAAPARPGPLPGAGRRAPAGRRRLGGRRGPARPAGRERHDPAGRRPAAARRRAGRDRGAGPRRPRPGPGRHRRGDRTDPALARRAGGPAGARRRRVELPGRRGGCAPGAARCRARHVLRPPVRRPARPATGAPTRAWLG